MVWTGWRCITELHHFKNDVGHGSITHVWHYLRWFQISKPLNECLFDHSTSCFCALAEFYHARRESSTMVVLWHCCRCLLNAHSGSGGLKSTLKGLADQRSVSSVSSAAASNATDIIWCWESDSSLWWENKQSGNRYCTDYSAFMTRKINISLKWNTKAVRGCTIADKSWNNIKYELETADHIYIQMKPSIWLKSYQDPHIFLFLFPNVIPIFCSKMLEQSNKTNKHLQESGKSIILVPKTVQLIQ